LGVFRWILLGRNDGLRAQARRQLRQALHPGRRVASDPAQSTGRPRGVPPLAAPQVPDGFVAVVRRQELEPGGLREVFVDGRPVALAFIDGEVHAFDGTCPHAGGPLAEGRLVGSTLSCPMHGWSFDVISGECHVNPEDRISILAVRVVDDVVCVQR
jgi:nitrite reductase (NADH) small subunit